MHTYTHTRTHRAAAYHAALQAHYDAALDRAKQRLERQAIMSKANLQVHTSVQSFTIASLRCQVG